MDSKRNYVTVNGVRLTTRLSDGKSSELFVYNSKHPAEVNFSGMLLRNRRKSDSYWMKPKGVLSLELETDNNSSPSIIYLDRQEALDFADILMAPQNSFPTPAETASLAYYRGTGWETSTQILNVWYVPASRDTLPEDHPKYSEYIVSEIGPSVLIIITTITWSAACYLPIDVARIISEQISRYIPLKSDANG